MKGGDWDGAKRIVDLKFDPARDDVTFQMDRLINILGGGGARPPRRKWPSAAPRCTG